MELICEHCGKKSEKYSIVSYTLEYLEEYLSEYFGKPLVDILNSNVKGRKWKKIKEICTYILYKGSGEGLRTIQVKYNLPFNPTKNFKWLIQSSDSDLMYIVKKLGINLKSNQ